MPPQIAWYDDTAALPAVSINYRTGNLAARPASKFYFTHPRGAMVPDMGWRAVLYFSNTATLLIVTREPLGFAACPTTLSRHESSAPVNLSLSSAEPRRRYQRRQSGMPAPGQGSAHATTATKPGFRVALRPCFLAPWYAVEEGLFRSTAPPKQTPGSKVGKTGGRHRFGQVAASTGSA